MARLNKIEPEGPLVVVNKQKLLEKKINGMPLALLVYRTKMISSTPIMSKVANMAEDLMSMISSRSKSKGSLNKQKLLELADSIPKCLKIMMHLAEKNPELSSSAQVDLVDTIRGYREQYGIHLEAFKDICWPELDQLDRLMLKDDIKDYQKTFDKVGEYLLEAVYKSSYELFPDNKSRDFTTSLRGERRVDNSDKAVRSEKAEVLETDRVNLRVSNKGGSQKNSPIVPNQYQRSTSREASGSISSATSSNSTRSSNSLDSPKSAERRIKPSGIKRPRQGLMNHSLKNVYPVSSELLVSSKKGDSSEKKPRNKHLG